MPHKNETGETAHKPFADRAQHFANVQRGIETLKRENNAAADSVRVVTSPSIMCNACLGAGGWDSGEIVAHCPACGGTGEVALTTSTALRPPVSPSCQICLDTGTAFGKRCDHPAAQEVALEAEPTQSDWKQAYLDQCRITDELTAKLEEGSDKVLLARIAELQAALATMNTPYADMQAAGDAAAMAKDGGK